MQMGAECSACGADLPYDSPCIVCDGSGLTWEAKYGLLSAHLTFVLRCQALSICSACERRLDVVRTLLGVNAVRT